MTTPTISDEQRREDRQFRVEWVINRLQDRVESLQRLLQRTSGDIGRQLEQIKLGDTQFSSQGVQITYMMNTLENLARNLDLHQLASIAVDLELAKRSLES